MKFGLLRPLRPENSTCAMQVCGMINPQVELKCSNDRLYRCSALNFLHWLSLKGQWVRLIPAHNGKWPPHIIGGVIDRRQWPQKNTWAGAAHRWHFKLLSNGGYWRDDGWSEHFTSTKALFMLYWVRFQITLLPYIFLKNHYKDHFDCFHIYDITLLNKNDVNNSAVGSWLLKMF